MDEVSDLCLNIGDSVNSLGDLYTCMDGESFDNDNGCRSPGLISWAFSPIGETDTNYQDFSFVIPEQSTSERSNHAVLEDSQPTVDVESGSPECHTQYQQQHQVPYNQPSRQINNQMNNYSEYIYPNNITYHHSVNIHNYVGNYCPPPWWDNHPFHPSQIGYDKKVPAPYVQMIEQSCDAKVGVATNQTAEYTRCSTPDYLLTLNALKQLDSPPRPNHSAAMSFPSACTSFEDKSNIERSSPQQDSGYNSDLNLSPVIQYQDQIKLRRHTSTPNPASNVYPALHRPNAHPLSQPTTSRFPHGFILPSFKPILQVCSDNIKGEEMKEHILPTTKPKVSMCPDNMKPEAIKEQIYQALQNKMQQSVKSAVHPNMPQTMPDQHQSSKEKLMSMAEYQMQKKLAAEKKEKLRTERTASVKRKADQSIANSDDSSKKRRHNEPLNQKALEVMNNWYEANSENPYPNKAEKEMIAKEGDISISQVKSWFANKRNRSNNTRPKKQKKEMEGRLMEICHQLARDAAKPNKDNAYYIQQLSSILH